jgi:antitoxin CptB
MRADMDTGPGAFAPSRNDGETGRLGADIPCLALYIRLARPRPGFWRWSAAMTERSSEGLDERRRKVLFRAWRRGVREIDLIVGRFADAHIATLDAAALDDFERLIEAPNAELYAWVVGSEKAPAGFDTTVLAKLRAFHMGTPTMRAGEER